jgi:membrane protease YdiL (CAAX protease family)
VKTEETPPQPIDPSGWFVGACIFEGALILVAWLIAALIDVPLFSDFHWDGLDALKGVAAAIPPVFLFVWSLSSEWRPLIRIRDALETFARPMFGGWSMVQILTLSLIAGIAEEVLFRSVVQGGLSGPAGAIGALLIASVLFGIAHMVTLGYAVIAGLMSVYIGWLWMQGGNLLIPITTHAVYDFIALLYFTRFAGNSGVKTVGAKGDAADEFDRGK